MKKSSIIILLTFFYSTCVAAQIIEEHFEASVVLHVGKKYYVGGARYARNERPVQELFFNRDFWLYPCILVLNEKFEKIGEKQFSGLMQLGGVRGLCSNSRNEFIAVFQGKDTSGFEDRSVILKLDTGLNVQWTKRICGETISTDKAISMNYVSGSNMKINNLVVDSKGNIVVCGEELHPFTRFDQPTGLTACVALVDPSGKIIRVNRFTARKQDNWNEFNCVAEVKDGYLLAGDWGIKCQENFSVLHVSYKLDSLDFITCVLQHRGEATLLSSGSGSIICAGGINDYSLKKGWAYLVFNENGDSSTFQCGGKSPNDEVYAVSMLSDRSCVFAVSESHVALLYKTDLQSEPVLIGKCITGILPRPVAIEQDGKEYVLLFNELDTDIPLIDRRFCMEVISGN